MSTDTTEATERQTRLVGLAARDVVKTFSVKGKENLVLDTINLEIPKGEFVSVIGPSGCGKSTLLRIFADLIPVTSGTAVVDGISPQLARADRRLGVVFQQANLMPWRSVLRNVGLPLEVEGRGKVARDATSRELLELVGLAGYEKHLPRQLSGGMQQRVAIARALSTEPDVLLMDEPFGALDEITRERLNQELLSIWGRLRPTVLFITHSIPEAVFLSSRVVVMGARPGRIVDVVDVDLPYPRDPGARTDPAFHAAESRIRALLATAGGH
ncbi:ABC transporter ATP-binding protein [Actinotalea fermentans]|uniref:Sulfonate ABC transporter ATP-binding lipoprotein n=1 Tax=Actinotalea fermentans TaxID=43671 RepID=A0A511YXE3_9CELL|nr:ABC transporter ATP-binding protein [Actinotalea fermentans]KGM17653.1 hypothetical protein N867_16830 [Actinotalea fermentans ATCC 43279 = JCM 9966 = DSM 3133]GEN79870.1 sulfonate ABC transporter ATP-binding lipoprotein [Actinotalea fermentans]